MDGWQIAAAITTIVQTVVVVVSVLFIWHQVRLQTKLARIANTQALVALSAPFNLEIAKDPQMAALWVRGCYDVHQYSEVDKCRYRYLLIWWLNLYENIYFQKKSGLLDLEMYRSWENDLKIFIRTQHLERCWGDLKGTLLKEFCNHVEELLLQDVKHEDQDAPNKSLESTAN
jgi:hypothetical protein